ncbi:uncharacterized protein HD556DRAFT_1401027 [Suillus plorans]|uniref:Uncharacterized protein n=1 Tax=Suillus plorans TaxID=116603 RepID=A0A9P7AGD0_9AGAM|nr:uncharacterized protein HD556DRAFT_1401027 [Suillus plorans]KAG1788956.1 hypothetical protein HD556DRAFT_1401027 [Suillus plorans]
MSLAKIWSCHLQGVPTLWTCQPIHAVPPIMDIPFPQGSVSYLSAVSESGSSYSFLNISFVNHPSPNENTIGCILALFFLILASRCRQDHPPPMALSAQLEQLYVIIRLFFSRRFQRYRHFFCLCYYLTKYTQFYILPLRAN